jgi:predicted dehydrogenase
VADGTWGNWTNIQVRRNLDGVSVDALPQTSSPAGSARNMAVSDTLSSSFYRDFAEALTTGRPPEIPAARSRDTIAIIEAARRSAATGEVVAPAAAKGSYGRG